MSWTKTFSKGLIIHVLRDHFEKILVIVVVKTRKITFIEMTKFNSVFSIQSLVVSVIFYYKKFIKHIIH